jgi:hypothetical protein
LIPTREKVAGGWRKPRNEELHNFILFTKYWDDKIKNGEMAETCSTHGRWHRMYRKY